jgi:hypothetical protein
VSLNFSHHTTHALRPYNRNPTNATMPAKTPLTATGTESLANPPSAAPLLAVAFAVAAPPVTLVLVPFFPAATVLVAVVSAVVEAIVGIIVGMLAVPQISVLLAVQYWADSEKYVLISSTSV